MFIGKWNKSVILTYIGLVISIFGIYASINLDNILIPLSCLILAGVCDLFDGFIARKCKRTDEEKNFGIELDSLVDVIDFIALPISIFISLKLNSWYNIISYFIFAVCGIARLAYFNIKVEDNNKAVKYYSGLPVTYTALIFPFFFLLYYVLSFNIFKILYSILIFIVAFLNILNIKVKKPKGKVYIFFALLAVITLIFYWVVLW